MNAKVLAETHFDEVQLRMLVQQFRRDVEAKFPSRVNLIDILGSNENDHTKILSGILRFRQDNSYLFLRSFLEMCQSVCDCRIEINVPRVETQRQYIDALIWEKGKYAVVVENKINNAIDQKEQIKRYIEAARELCDLKEDCGHIYVVYLTADGRKKVGDWSLTKEAKTLLGFVDEKKPGRFIELNYRDNILPWLKEAVIVNCRYGEQVLLSMLQQYIDYLENRFDITEGRKNQCAVSFFDRKLMFVQESHEKYIWLKRLREVLGSTRWEDSNDRISADALFAGASGYAESLLNANFAINQQDAYDSKVSIIQAWAVRNGFRRPYKCRPYECVFFEYRIGEMKCRIKFQVVIPTSGAELKVMFFNNDYDKGRVGVNEFPELTEKFRELFPRVDGEGPQYITSLAGNYNSERELLRFLDEKIKPFVIAYDRWFDAAKQTISLG